MADTVIKYFCGNGKPCIIHVNSYDINGNIVLQKFGDEIRVFTYDSMSVLIKSVIYYDKSASMGIDWSMCKYTFNDSLETESYYTSNDSITPTQLSCRRYNSSGKLIEFKAFKSDSSITQLERIFYLNQTSQIREIYSYKEQIISSWRIDTYKNSSVTKCLKSVLYPEDEGAVLIQRRWNGRYWYRSISSDGKVKKYMMIEKRNKSGRLLKQTLGENVIMKYKYKNGLLVHVTEGNLAYYIVNYGFY